MNKLDEIIRHKRAEVEALLPRAAELRREAARVNRSRSFFEAIRREGSEHSLSLIAEVKKASPSAGVIAGNFDPVAIAIEYEAAGANAISVLTDEKFFQGGLADLIDVRQAVTIPVLRKDFIVHEVQVHESAIAGADAILLIVAALDQEALVHLLDVAHTCELDAIVEVHDLRELDRALETEARIIGINNRNLKTFEVDLHTTEALAEEAGRDVVLVSESGIRTAEDARAAKAWGADAILVGEALMRSGDIRATVRALIDA